MSFRVVESLKNLPQAQMSPESENITGHQTVAPHMTRFLFSDGGIGYLHDLSEVRCAQIDVGIGYHRRIQIWGGD